MPQVYLHAAARGDLVEHFVYLSENAGLDTAERFLNRVEASFEDLALQPRMGAPLRLRPPELSGLRKWRVRDFDNHLIFYRSRAEGINVVRVLHAARDWWGLLGIDA